MWMPFSIAAWSTVFPFSTVTERPSMVSVTVSIRLDDSPGTPEIRASSWGSAGSAHRGDRLLPADLRPSQDARERDLRLDDPIAQLDHELRGRLVEVVEDDGDGHVEGLAGLFEAKHDFLPVAVRLDLPGERHLR